MKKKKLKNNKCEAVQSGTQTIMNTEIIKTKQEAELTNLRNSNTENIMTDRANEQGNSNKSELKMEITNQETLQGIESTQLRKQQTYKKNAPLNRTTISQYQAQLKQKKIKERLENIKRNAKKYVLKNTVSNYKIVKPQTLDYKAKTKLKISEDKLDLIVFSENNVSISSEIVEANYVSENIEFLLPNDYKIIIPEPEVRLIYSHGILHYSIPISTLSEKDLLELKGDLPKPEEILILKKGVLVGKAAKRTTRDDVLKAHMYEINQLNFSTLKHSTVSKHRNFDVEKRFLPSITSKILKLSQAPLGCSNIYQQIEYLKDTYDDSLFQISEFDGQSVYLLPKTLLEIYMFDMIITSRDVTLFTTDYLIHSMEKQDDLNPEQFTKLLTILTTIDLLAQSYGNDLVDLLISYQKLFLQNLVKCSHLLSQNYSCSPKDIYGILKCLKIIVPYETEREITSQQDLDILRHDLFIREEIKEVKFEYEQVNNNMLYFSADITSLIKQNQVSFENGRFKINKTTDISVEQLLELFASGKMRLLVESFKKINFNINKLPKFIFKPHTERPVKGTIDEIFETESAKHTTTNPHHVEYWQGEQMSVHATIELLIDHWVCARRYEERIDYALIKSLSWLSQPKFSIINPYGLYVFLSTVSGFNFVALKNAQVKTPYKKWNKQFTSEEINELLESYQNNNTHVWLARNLAKPKVYNFIMDLNVHRLLVNSMYSAVTGSSLDHDRDKSKSSYMGPLLLKFGRQEQKPIILQETAAMQHKYIQTDLIKIPLFAFDIVPSKIKSKLVSKNSCLIDAFLTKKSEEPDFNQENIEKAIVEALNRESDSKLEDQLSVEDAMLIADILDYKLKVYIEPVKCCFMWNPSGLTPIHLLLKDEHWSLVKEIESPIKGPQHTISGDKDFIIKTLLKGDTKLATSIMDKIKNAYKSVKQTVTKPGAVLDDISNLTEKYDKLANDVYKTGLLGHDPNIIPQKGQVRAIYEGIGTLLKTMFDKLLTQIWDKFNIPFVKRVTIPITKLIFTYIMYQNTESSIAKAFIILDLLVEMNLLDIIVSIFQHAWKLVKDFFSESKVEENCNCWLCQTGGLKETSGVSFAEALAKMQITDDKKQEETNKEEKCTLEEQEESYFSTIWHGFMTSTPYIVGAVGSAMLGMMGYNVARLNRDRLQNIGNNIINGMKNIHYLTLGAMALNKSFTLIASCFDWAMTKFTQWIGVEYQTKHATENRLTQWLQTIAMFEPGFVEPLLVSHPNLCYDVQTHYLEGLTLKTKISKLSFAHQRAFNIAFEKLATIYPKAHAMAKIQAGTFEPFHVQIVGEPGIGKTDLSQRIVEKVGLEFHSHPTTSTYPINENLDHMDNYCGQKIGIIDEDNISQNITPEKLVSRLMLFSGASLIAPMANLSDKGKIIELEFVVSNTNNAFPIFKNAFDSTPWWRRRLLVKAELAVACPKGVLLKTFLQENFTSEERSACKHLRFKVLDPVDSDETPIIDERLTLEQLLQYLTAAAKSHKIIERKRNAAAGKDMLKQVLDSFERFKDITPQNEQQNFQQLLKINLSKMQEVSKDYKKWMEQSLAISKISETSHIEELKKEVFLEAIYDERFGRFTFEPASSEEIDHSIIPTSRLDPSGFKIESGHIYYYTTDQSLALMALHAVEEIISLATLNDRKTYEQALAEWKEIQSVRNEIEKRKYQKISILQTTMDTIKKLTMSTMKLLWTVTAMTLATIFSTMVVVGSLFLSLKVLGLLLNPTPKKLTETSGNLTNRKPLDCTSSLKPYFTHHTRAAIGHIFMLRFETIVNNRRMICFSNMVGIRGNVFLINEHACSKFQGSQKVEVYDNLNNTWTESIVNWDKRVPLSNSKHHVDACLIVLENFRTIGTTLKQWVEESNLSSTLEELTVEGHVATMQPHSTNPTPWIATCDVEPISWEELKNSVHEKSDTVKNMKITRALQANFPSVTGQSGSLLMHSNCKIPNSPYCGISIASYDETKTTYFCVITREIIEEALNKINFAYKIDTPKMTTMKNATITLTNSCEASNKYSEIIPESRFYGNFKPSQAVSHITSFVKTPIFGVRTSETQPAILSPYDKRIKPGSDHPYKVALSKYAAEKVPLLTPSEELAAINSLTMRYMSIDGMKFARIWDKGEAVAGSRMPHSTSINTSSSPGLPYKLVGNKGGKKDYIEFNELTGSWEVSDEIWQDLERYIEFANSGIVEPGLKLEFIKDELVGENKILTPRTRTVSTGNVIHQLVYRMLYGDIIRILKHKADGTHYCAVGINPESIQWHKIAVKNLIRKDATDLNRIIELDVKCWESIVTQQLLRIATQAKLNVLKQAYKSRGEIFPNWCEKVAHTLVVDFSDALVVFDDIIFRKTQGMLSGHPGTLVENSDVHYALLYTIFCRAMKEKGFEQKANHDYYYNNIGLILAADDVLLSMSQQVSKIIQPQDIFEQYRKLNISITAANKSEILEFQNITQVSFLKMQFQFNGSVYTVRPKQSIIFGLLNWARNNTLEQFNSNLFEAFRYASWWGEEYYESLRHDVNVALLARKYPPFTRMYFEMRASIRTSVHAFEYGSELSLRHPMDRVIAAKLEAQVDDFINSD